MSNDFAPEVKRLGDQSSIEMSLDKIFFIGITNLTYWSIALYISSLLTKSYRYNIENQPDFQHFDSLSES